MTLARVKDVESELAHGSEHASYRFDAGPCQRDVVPEQIDVSPLAAEIGLHVDDHEGGVVGFEVAVEGPCVRVCRYVLHPMLLSDRCAIGEVPLGRSSG